MISFYEPYHRRLPFLFNCLIVIFVISSASMNQLFTTPPQAFFRPFPTVLSMYSGLVHVCDMQLCTTFIINHKQKERVKSHSIQLRGSSTWMTQPESLPSFVLPFTHRKTWAESPTPAHLITNIPCKSMENYKSLENASIQYYVCIITQSKSLCNDWRRNRRVGLQSTSHLSTSILLHSLIGRHWIGRYFFYFLLFTSLLPFFPFPILSLPILLSSSAPSVCSLWHRKAERECVDECVWILFFFPFSSCSRLLFSFFFLFLVSQGDELGGPLNVHRERQGPLLVSSIVTIHAEASWITLLLKEGQVLETSQRLKETPVSLVCSHFLFCHQWMYK